MGASAGGNEERSRRSRGGQAKRWRAGGESADVEAERDQFGDAGLDAAAIVDSEPGYQE